MAMTPLERLKSRVGPFIEGKYRIDALIGVGGMAAVYAASQRDGSRVAIKMLLERWAVDSDAWRLFRREAQAANEVGHEGAVPVLDEGQDEDGYACLVMPLLEGETVRERCKRLGARLPLA